MADAPAKNQTMYIGVTLEFKRISFELATFSDIIMYLIATLTLMLVLVIFGICIF